MKRALLVLAFFISSCKPIPVHPPTLTKRPTVVFAFTSTIPPTLTKVIVPTATATLLATPTLPEGAKLIEHCPMQDTEPSLRDVTTGTILQADSLWDLQTGKKYKLPSRSAIAFDHYGLQVSPNRNMLAYIENTSNQQQILWVVDAHANVLAKRSFERNDVEQPRWLDNERLVFYTAETDQGGTILVMNPFTNEQTSISNELPDILRFPGIRGGSTINWLVEYSPDLQKAAYLAAENNGTLWRVTFRDISAGKTIWQTSSFLHEARPIWSPDGHLVAINDSQKLYLVNDSGRVQPVLNENPSGEWGAILDEIASWSPDGQKLAFWNKRSLVTYALETQEAIRLCIHSQLRSADPVRWSPDSNQLIVYGYDEELRNVDSLMFIVVDLQKNLVYPHLSDVQNINPDVWMNSLP